MLTWGLFGRWSNGTCPSVRLVPVFLSEDGPGHFGRQPSSTDFYHTIPYPLYRRNLLQEAALFLRTPFTEGGDGVDYQTWPPGRSNELYF